MKTIKELYQTRYPECEYGAQICPEVSVFTVIAMVEHVYDLIEVHDSIVREGVFNCIAEVMGVKYASIYELWMERRAQLNDRIAIHEQVIQEMQEQQAWDEYLAEQGRNIILTNDFEQSIGE